MAVRLMGRHCQEQAMSHILIVDDNPIFRLGLRELVKAARPDLAVVEDETFSGARSHLKGESNFVLIMIDMKVRDFGGFVGLFQLRTEFPNVPVIVFSTSTYSESVSRAVAFGAAGYISKSAPCDQIARTLKASLSGKDFGTVPIIANENQINPIAALSPAQLRVLKGLKKGLRNKEIAFELGLTEKTVKAYMSTLYRKLGVSTRTQALLLLQEVSL
jgi:DNA-binding NarL/FixJ family response regulator